MKRLIKLQLRNVYHSKLFYVCLGLTLILPMLTVFINKLNIPGIKADKVFPEIIGFLSDELSIISIVFVALFCCFDFNEKTTKNIIARGYTKTKLLFSKYIVSLIALFSMYIMTSLLIFILFFNKGIGFDENTILLLLNNIIKIIALTIFFATLSFLLEKNGSAIIACIFIPNIVPLLLGAIDSYLKLNTTNFWITNLSNTFIKNPTLSNFGLSSLYYLIYIVVIIFIGIELLKKKEIK